MNGAESLVQTLVKGGVDTCFANPGTSEMHFVAALDRVGGMRCVLTLFEGVASGAADGYGRMTDKPAATLLHLGPGLGNALANLHNARKARTPLVNIVGDHAVHHRSYDAPLTSDVEGVARPMSDWVRTSTDARYVADDGADAVAAALSAPGGVATLILPADTAWNDATGVAAPRPVKPAGIVDAAAVSAAAKALRSGEPTLIFLGGRALRAAPLDVASRIAAATGAKLLAPSSNPRMERGAGRAPIRRLPYPLQLALQELSAFKHIILVGVQQPVAFFAYPGMPSLIAPPGSSTHVLASPAEDCVDALARLASELNAPGRAALVPPQAPAALPAGKITVESIGAAIAALIPEGAIVVDEGISCGRAIYPASFSAPPHDWLQLNGGSIGIGMPLATGAAIACPGRKVISLQADGSGMYTLQALWTQARETLDVTTIIFSNRSYASLEGELINVGALNPGKTARAMLDIGSPDLDWVKLAGGMGVEGARAETAERLIDLLQASLRRSGPFLIEVMV
ncbi:MAG: acetolactate synthase large subunit [Bosea sp.]|uniref:acetolactate synthase large subunit n=1 Tax=Bosea sp. (in: a-proteobacteria) TaxID=1871050 RepID=UPI001AC812F1|nr:acetolactate synthase large subunit [Bosea sp. (in: a-proteobacteria)]MBN9453465.1 acetolactate synthase large subunit [Bosea sp. (in: a-proteobacteria)]